MSHERTLRTVEFRIDGEVVESVQHVPAPRVGETVEIGVKFTDDGRLDPGIAEFDEWFDADYQTVIQGHVTDVTRHYHSSRDRSELTVYVDVVEPVDP